MATIMPVSGNDYNDRIAEYQIRVETVINALRKQLSQAIDHIRNSSESQLMLQERNIERLSQAAALMESRDSELKASQLELKTSNDEITRLTDQLGVAKASLAQLSSELSKSREQLHQQRTDALAAEKRRVIDDEEKRIADIKALAVIKRERDQLSIALVDLQKQFRAEMNVKEGQVSMLMAKVIALENQLEDTSDPAMIDRIQDDLSRERSEKRTYQSQCEVYKEEIRSLLSQVQSLSPIIRHEGINR